MLFVQKLTIVRMHQVEALFQDQMGPIQPEESGQDLHKLEICPRWDESSTISQLSSIADYFLHSAFVEKVPRAYKMPTVRLPTPLQAQRNTACCPLQMPQPLHSVPANIAAKNVYISAGARVACCKVHFWAAARGRCKTSCSWAHGWTAAQEIY